MVSTPGTARRVDAAERRAQVLELRRSGLGYLEIGRRLGVSKERAWKLAQQGMADLVREPAEEVRQLDLARLDGALQVAWRVLHTTHVRVNGGEVVVDPTSGQPLVDNEPNLRAVDRIVRILERRAKLLGLDAPVQVELTMGVLEAEIARLEAELESGTPAPADHPG